MHDFEENNLEPYEHKEGHLDLGWYLVFNLFLGEF